MKKEYTGSVYVAVVGGEIEIGECRDTLDKLVLRPGDSGIHRSRGTKGYESRQSQYDKWFDESNHPFLLLLDHDMAYPPDTLERLRSHELPYVSGFYLRRFYAPFYPVWHKFSPTKSWPMVPWTTDPERGKLHKLGASGWGCLLLHREVAEAVHEILKGEKPIIEDDMDIWPYDLKKVMWAINGLKDLVESKPPARVLRAAVEKYSEVLTEEIRPLRTKKNVVGSDLRYPFYAREAGYILMGDPDVRCGHNINYPLNPNDFSQQADVYYKELTKSAMRAVKPEREEIRENLNNLIKADR